MPVSLASIFPHIYKLAQNRHLNGQLGLTILIVEQNVTLALEMCDRAYVLETGQIRMEGCGSDLLHDSRVMESYLGISK